MKCSYANVWKLLKKAKVYGEAFECLGKQSVWHNLHLCSFLVLNSKKQQAKGLCNTLAGKKAEENEECYAWLTMCLGILK